MTDDEPTVGIASTTTEPMELEIDVTPQPIDGTAKLQLLGDPDLPERGIRTTAFLTAADLRALGEELFEAADALDDHADAREAAADD